MKTTLALLSLFAITPACVAQQPTKAPPREPFVVAAGEVTLETLIDRCAAYLDCNILWSPQELQNGPSAAALKLQKAISVDATGCEEFLANALYRSGLALTWLDDRGELREVISLAGPRAREVSMRALERSTEEVLARPNLKLWVTTVVPLEHINATIATNALRPFFATTGSPHGSSLTIGNVGGAKSMLVSGMQDQVAQAIRLLRKCDLPGSMDAMGMPGSQGDERVPALERRVKALEEQLGKARPVGSDSKAR